MRRKLLRSLSDQIKNVSDLPLGVMERIELVLILIEEKPATDLSLKIGQGFREEHLRGLLGRIRKIGLVCEAAEKEFFVASRTKRHVDAYWRILVFVAKTEKNMLALKNATSDEELGRLYGFPETAIKAFVGKDGFTRLEVRDEPEEVTSCDFRFLLQFIISRENWQDEREQMRRKFKRLLKVAPRLVEEQRETDKVTSDRIFADEEVTAVETKYRRLRASLVTKTAQ